jgi:hypothetical protein
VFLRDPVMNFYDTLAKAVLATSSDAIIAADKEGIIRGPRVPGQRASGPLAFFQPSRPPSMWQAAVRPASCAACTAMAERSPKAQ